MFKDKICCFSEIRGYSFRLYRKGKIVYGLYSNKLGILKKISFDKLKKFKEREGDKK